MMSIKQFLSVEAHLFARDRSVLRDFTILVRRPLGPCGGLPREPLAPALLIYSRLLLCKLMDWISQLESKQSIRSRLLQCKLMSRRKRHKIDPNAMTK